MDIIFHIDLCEDVKMKSVHTLILGWMSHLLMGSNRKY